ncbi:MAG: alpha-2-macroglobulin [Chitinophagaceae bacterium]|nr:alpha-2-macroglobulin [Chitinophagaceae bacterium]
MKMLFIKNFYLLLGICCLFTLTVHSQSPVKKYEKEWKKVEAFAEKGLPKSALAEVKKIYALSKIEKQDAQLIKSLVYMTDLQSENREDNETFSIAEIEKEITGTKEPVTALLKSLLADMYWNYYQQHRWKLYNRTKTENFSKTDIATWDAEDFHKKISALYLQSIKEEKLLQKTKLEAYDAIILKGNVRHLRPTLYDLLAHRALSYFENDERDIKKPAYAFEINQADAFDPAAVFITRKFTTPDSLSLQHKALLIYQKLIALHGNDARPDALIDADLQRIEFVKTKSTHPDKEKLYFNAISQIANQYPALPAASQAWYLVAAWYEQKAAEYKPYGDTTQRFARIKAKEILERVLLQKDSSEGKVNAYNLLNTINSRSFQFSVEKVNVPGQPFRSLVKYRNITSLYLRLIKADEALKTALENQYDEKYWPAIVNASPLKTWQQTLPVTNDLQQHSTEIKVDALPPGEYILAASTDKDFNGRNTIIGARFLYVSGISYVNNSNDFFVVDRDNGQPLVNAAVQTWQQKYDYKQSKYIKEKGKSYTTDAHGFFKMEKPKKEITNYTNYSYLLDITHGKDRLFMNDLVYDYYYYYNYNEDEDEEPETLTSIHLFTDRSIYRPGQTVYFKGIVLSRNQEDPASGKAGRKTGVRNDYSTTVFLRDANSKDVDSLLLKTNEFGSFNGRFQLPQSGINGQFTIYTKTDDGNAGFRVEEYKRPKFYVDYEPIKGTYKVNDKIKVTGIAKAYAGNAIDGALVKYRIVRQPRFLYAWMFWRWWQPPAEEMEIAHGETKTDKDGKFVVGFTAIPDLNIEKKFEPVFDYRIYADITDINGETRSGEKMVSVSYKSLMLVSSVPARLPADSLKSLFIRTQNMNGEYEPAKVKVTITKLKEEKRLIRDRYWDRPDQFVMSQAEYIGNFPYDEYDNETDLKSWEKEKELFNKTDSARENGLWTINRGQWTSGFYIIEMETKDKNGEPVKDLKYIELFDEKNKQLNRPDYLWTGISKTTVEPGETAKVELGTAADNLFVVHQVDKGTINNKLQNINYTFIQINNEKKIFSFPAAEADRGGYGVGWLFIKHNRYYQLNQTISIPWTNKELTVEYASFRDKTLPGSEEKWKIKISGYKNEKVAAEMLAGMYDASLDQFYAHSWSQPNIWPWYYNSRNWSGSQNFTTVESNQKNIGSPESKSLYKQYDYLLSSEQNRDYYGGGVYRLGKPVTAEADGKNLEEVVVTGIGVKKQAKELGYSVSKTKDGNGVSDELEKEKTNQQTGEVKIRKNFNETAFFFPELRTDSTGAIAFTFTMPEALTRWKFMALAHTKEAAFGSSTKEIVTQKELMVQPNPPRFLREGDKMEFSSKIVNLSGKELTGTAEFQLFDAETNEPIDGRFKNVVPNQYFTVAAGQSEVVKFPIEVPYLFNKALVWRIVARAPLSTGGEVSDGEENMLPILTNRMLVTETMPLPMRGTGTKNFTFEKLVKTETLASQPDATLQHYSLTVEYTSNPAWYAVQALPYLMEYPYECAEQTWNRYYANSLASFISNSSPRIKQVFEKWKVQDTAALMSNLQKNLELKSVLLEETPWVLQAKNEAEQKRNIALLFDMIKMSEQLNNSYEKLKQMQSSNGGFVWFTGGPDDRYMTQYIATGIGHLKKLKGIAEGQDAKLKALLSTAIPYLDRKIKEDYDYLIKYKANLKQQHIGYTQIQYLYMRSFFPENKIDAASQTAYNYYYKQAQQYWVGQGKYMQGMIALALHRGNLVKTEEIAPQPTAILKSLKETSITNEELGMYWKDQTGGWFWYQAPIETQALLIEVFQEVDKDDIKTQYFVSQTVDDLRTWLLKNKQTNNWKTTKATAEACYALLIQGTVPSAIGVLGNEPVVEIKLGSSTTIKSTEAGQEAGTGYFKKTIEGDKIKSDMGNISVTVSHPPINQSTNQPINSVSWGAVYWQYFEDLDKITTASTPLKLVKKLFVEKNTDRGPVITPVNDGNILKVGDKIKVRVELRVDRDMEYVHMKDMRASALEPVNVLSSYKYQGGLGYYESTKDASTNFFFSYLRKGTYVFEYTLFATHAGNFSNGVTTIQCMYAPEFTSHSEGVRIKVE